LGRIPRFRASEKEWARPSPSLTTIGGKRQRKLSISRPKPFAKKLTKPLTKQQTDGRPSLQRPSLRSAPRTSRLKRHNRDGLSPPSRSRPNFNVRSPRKRLPQPRLTARLTLLSRDPRSQSTKQFPTQERARTKRSRRRQPRAPQSRANPTMRPKHLVQS